MNNLQSLSLFWPELILTVTVLSAIIADLFLPKEKSTHVAWFVFVGLVFSGIAILTQNEQTTTLFMDAIALTHLQNFSNF